MTEVDTVRIRAKYRLKLLFMLLVFVIFVGVFWEYQRMTQPLDEVAVIYVNGDNAAEVVVVPEVVNETAVPSEAAQTNENTPSADAQKDENQPAPQVAEENKENDNSQALPEFLNALKHTQEVVEQAQYSEPVLNKIIQAEPKTEPQSAEPKVFQDGKIEVYDSTKGVVGVVEEPKVEAKPEVKVENVKENVEVKEEAKPEPKLQEEEVKEVSDKAKQVVQDVAEAANDAVETAVEAKDEAKDLVKEEIEAVIEQEKSAAEKAEESVRQRVNYDLGQVEEAGEEAPIVLIPGLTSPAEPKAEVSESPEN